MAAPHVSGRRCPAPAAASRLDAPIRSRAPSSPPSRPLGPGAPVAPTRVGAGFVDLVAADNPLLLASPSSVTFGPLEPGRARHPTDRARGRRRRRRRVVGRRRARRQSGRHRRAGAHVGRCSGHARAHGTGGHGRRRGGRRRHADAKRRRETHPVLAPRVQSGPRGRADDTADPAGRLPRQHARPAPPSSPRIGIRRSRQVEW